MKSWPETGDPHLLLIKFKIKLKLGIGPRSIENIVVKYLTEVGVHGASMRSLRHTFGTHTVKRALGSG